LGESGGARWGREGIERGKIGRGEGRGRRREIRVEAERRRGKEGK